MKVLVVAGYGATPVLRYAPETEHYLVRVRELLLKADAMGNPFSHLILCGGRTQQKTSPGISEAFAMAKRLEELDMELNVPEHPVSPFFAKLRVVLEEDSFTSLENAENAGRRIQDLQWEETFDLEPSITVMCEGMRLLKWQILAKVFFPSSKKPIRWEIVSWEQMSPLKELAATIWDTCSVYLPVIGIAMAWWWGWRRRRRAKYI
ncbi:MAG: hypothetical protein AAB463_02980 [Patescibacteria group bacterium]